nr:MAG TPA: hypothetical protein [Caudoviricetes sp.]
MTFYCLKEKVSKIKKFLLTLLNSCGILFFVDTE